MDFDELKEAVKNYKNRNQKNAKEEDETIIEKGVENIRQSYILNQFEYPNLDLNNNLNNTNNNININYDYNVINYKNIKNSNIYNNNNDYQNDINKNNIQTIQNNLNQNNINTNEELENQANLENQTNTNIQPKEPKESEFEVIDETNIHNLKNNKETIPCMKQTENSLTNLNNLQVFLES